MKKYILDPKAALDDVKKSGVYTVYKSNRLDQSLAVINLTSAVVQFMFDEKVTPVTLQRREFDGMHWSDWKTIPMP